MSAPPSFVAFALSIAVLALPLAARAASSSSPAVVAVRAVAPPPQDASLDDPVCSTALRVTDFENVTTESPAADATTALLLFDDKNVYVGFVAEQRRAPVMTTQHTNDVGYGLDDSVTVALDTSGGNSREYAFTATPAGVR